MSDPAIRMLPQREAGDAGAQAAEALAPETSLAGNDLDPLSLGGDLTAVGRALAERPLEAMKAFVHYAAGLAAVRPAAISRMLGEVTPGPVTPGPKDKRFNDPTWTRNPFFFALQQRYLLWADLLDELVERSGVEVATAKRATFALRMVSDALAPTNFLATNPVALKRALETGGASVAKGLANFVDDVRNNGGMPRQVDTTVHHVGQNLAVTPGKVVFRNELMELLQYAPTTETVHEIPLLCSPPWINKYYIMDLAPGRSFVQWAVDHGHTVFAVSYRNPDTTMKDLRFDDYLIDGLTTAIDTIQDITGAPAVNVVGLCLGGTLTTMMLAYLGATGDARVRSATLLNTLIDFSEPGDLGVFTDAPSVARLEKRMAAKGFLDAADMARTFDMLRSNDLIWNYVASNWLMGEDPPAFDILTWNADATRMPAKMHSFYLRSCYLENRLARGVLELQGTELNPGDIKEDVYLLAAQEDHIVPWTSSYKATKLLKGDVRFVLSSSGHIAGIVNPPSAKARYWTNASLPDKAEEWRASAEEHQASWWEDWAEWIAERAGAQRQPPPFGRKGEEPLGDAPGTYVLER